VINVAGPAALLVAKAFKLGERLETPRRLLSKDAGDVFRLYEAKTVGEIIERLRRVADDERSADVAGKASATYEPCSEPHALPASGSRSTRSARWATRTPWLRRWSTTPETSWPSSACDLYYLPSTAPRPACPARQAVSI